MLAVEFSRGSIRLSSRVAPFILAAAFAPKLLAIGGKLMKSVKAVKIGLVGASVAAYSWLFTWEFSVGLIVSLVIHEYGHIWAMKKVGIPTRGFYLIPFVGGIAVPERAFKSRLEEHFVAIAGPAFGLAQAAALYAGFVLSGAPLLGAIAAWVAALNLFNMIPITPLDGGRIVKSATMSVGSGFGMFVLLAGILLAVVGMFALRSWILAIVVLFSVFEFLMERRSHRLTPEPWLKRMPHGQTAWCLFTYVLVCAAFVAILVGCLAVPEARLAMMLLQDG